MGTSRARGGTKVLLVNYAGYVLTGNTFVPDSSLATLAAALQREGIAVEILDLQNPADIGSVMEGVDPAPASQVLERLGRGEAIGTELFETYRHGREAGQRRFQARVTRELLDRIAHDDIGLVGFKAWAGNGLAGTVAMAEAVREAFPDLPLVAGGPAVSYGRELLLTRAPVFDAAVYGDGEEAIVALARGEREAPGIIRREGSRLVARAPRHARQLDAVAAPVYSPGGWTCGTASTRP